MTRSSEASSELVGVMRAGDAVRHQLSPMQFRLRVAGGILALLNGIALFFYLSPPGGTRLELERQSSNTQFQIVAAKMQTGKLQNMASKVQTGSDEATAFAGKYFLPKRTAYVAVFEEIQRMAKESGIQERDASWTEEPVEGTADLTVLNISASYQGTNENLMKFLYQADHSPMLLMLDTMAASPEQRNNQINTVMRFQAIVREPNGAAAGGAQ